jgi:hypothetical protein
MKNNVLPRLSRSGGLDKVAFAHVNADRDSRIAKSVMKGGTIPQLIMYRKTPTGWRRHMLVGAQSPEKIEAFINQGLKLDEADALQAAKANQASHVSYQSPE